MLRIILAGLHLLALGLGLGAVLQRGSALRDVPEHGAVRRGFRTDAVWGLAAILWLGTGLWRLFGAMEKSSAYYGRNPLFHAKMGLFVLILALEIWPMITLIRWRRAHARGVAPETFAAPATGRRMAIISHVEALLVVIMIFVSVAMARGLGAR